MDIAVTERKKKILVIDDAFNTLSILENFLLKNDYEVFTAIDGESGFDMARSCMPDLILLDVMMPGDDGYVTCRNIRSCKEIADVPIIFITAMNQQDDILKAFEAGGNDYVVKPFFFHEVLHRIRVHVENKLLREQLYEMSMKDLLTELWNRRYFIDNAIVEFERSIRHKRNMSFVICDIDNFKKINDSYGHCAGDNVLKRIAETMQDSVRPSDCVGRWGGEEFVVLFPETDKLTAAEVADRMRHELSELRISCESGDIQVTLSFGVSDLKDLDYSGNDFDSIYTIADKRLYAAKKAGKNRVICQ